MPLLLTIIISLWPSAVRPYAPTIERASLHYHVDPNLVAAIIWNESRGDENAYRYEAWIGVPSVGLMQVAAFSWRPDANTLRIPSYNIWYGTSILSEIITDNLKESVAVYNCGYTGVRLGRCGRFGGYHYANKVIQSCRQFGGCPELDFRGPR